MASMVDVVFFSLDYRLAPENKAPEGFKDCKVAAEHLLANSDKYCFDTKRFCMMGLSGGSH